MHLMRLHTTIKKILHSLTLVLWPHMAQTHEQAPFLMELYLRCNTRQLQQGLGKAFFQNLQLSHVCKAS